MKKQQKINVKGIQIVTFKKNEKIIFHLLISPDIKTESGAIIFYKTG